MADSTLGNIIGGSLGLLQTGLDAGTSYYNYQLQQQAQAYQRDFAENAVQIRMRDLEKAGLNPLLAVGQAAQQPSTITPHVENVDLTKTLRGVQEAQAIASTKGNLLLMMQQAKKLEAETQGQMIQNQFAERMAQTQLDRNILELEFDKQSNPLKIKAQVLGLTGQELDNRNKQLDLELNRLKIDQATVNLVLSELERQQKVNNLTLQQKEIVAKQIAIETDQAKLDSFKYDRAYYTANGLPMGFQTSPLNWLGTGMAKSESGLRQILNTLFGGK